MPRSVHVRVRSRGSLLAVCSRRKRTCTSLRFGPRWPRGVYVGVLYPCRRPHAPWESLTGPRQIAAARLSGKALPTSLPRDRSDSAQRARGSQQKSLFGRTFTALVRSAEKRLRGVHHEMRSHSMTASLSVQPSKNAPLAQIRCGPGFSGSGADPFCQLQRGLGRVGAGVFED